MQTRIDASKLELTETIVDIRRVAKTVKGGRNMRFSVTVVVGDGEGHVGMGLGKAIEIPEAVRKATEDAKKKMIYVPTVGTTVPHETIGEFGAGKVLIMPSAKGTGVIAGSSVRTVKFSSCLQQRVPELSQDPPFVQYSRQQVSRM